MSDLAAVEALSRQLEARRSPAVGVIGPAHANEEETNFFEDSLFYVGKPEEWLVQLIGRTFTDDPKYRADSSNLYDQVSFFDIAQDVTGVTGTAGNLVLNLPLGLAAAILNPLDPLNVASIGKLTRAGTMARLATRAKKTVKGVRQIDIAEDLAELKKKAGFATGRGSPQQRARAVKRYKKQIPALHKVNQWLEFMQKEKGIPFEELVEKKTFFERVRAGQQTLLGFDPFSNRIIRKAGGVSKKDRVAMSAIRIKGADAVLGAGVFPLMRAGARGKELAVKALNRLLPAGARIPDTEVKKFIAGVIHSAQRARRGEQEYNAQEALRQYNFLGRGVSKEDVHSILDQLEDIFGGVETRLLRDIVDRDSESLFSGIRQKMDRNAEGLGVKGVDLTRQQREMIGGEGVRRGLKSEEDLNIAVGRAREAFQAGSFHTKNIITIGDHFYSDSQFAVLRISSGDAARTALSTKTGELAELNVPGLVPFSTLEDQSGFYLVTSNVGVHPDAQWTNVHVENLEKMAALLAQKGYFLKDAAPGGIMIGRNGEVQIMNPNIVGKIKKNVKGGMVKNAADLSRNTMRGRLFGRIGLSEDYDFSILGQHSSDPRIVRSVRPEDIHFQDLTPDAKHLRGTDTVRYFNVEDLLQAHNAGYAKILDPETTSRLGIDVLAAEMDQAGVMSPVRIRVDDRGQIYVSEGLERLAAARHLGLEAVPVIREDFVGDITRGVGATIEGSELPLRGPTRSAAEVMSEKAGSYDTLPESVAELLPQDVRILDSSNKPIAITEEAFEAVDESNVVYQMAEWFSRRSSSDPQAEMLGPDWFDRAETAFLDAIGVDGNRTNTRRAYLQLEQALQGASEPHDLLRLISDKLRLPHGEAQAAAQGVLSTDFSLMRAEMHLMQEQFKNLTRSLNEGGVFTQGSRVSAIGDYTARTGRTILRVTDEGIRLTNLTKSVEEMQLLAEGYLRQQASDMSGLAKVELIGTTPTTMRAGSLLGSPEAAAFGPVLPADLTFFATPATRKALREKGIFINPSKADLAAAGVADVASRLAVHPNGVFAYSMSGSLIFAPGHNSVEKLMTDLFGQAPRSMQEFGVFTKDGIQISNVLGLRSASKLTPQELAAAEQRLKDAARKLVKAGFDPGMTFGVHTPFGDDLWNQMFRKDTKLGDVASKDFRIDIPENVKGASLELYDERGAFAVHDRATKLPEGRVRNLFKWVEDNLDETALRELEAGLPINVRAGYYPRFMTPEVLARLDTLGFSFFAEGRGKFFDYWIQNFKGRKLSDLTTREVNRLFKDLQISPDDMMAFDKLHGSKFMRSLAELDPKAAAFFVEDPILATTMRKDLSAKALTNQQAWAQLSDPENGFVVWSGSVDDYVKRQGAEAASLSMWKRADDTAEQARALREDLRAAINEERDPKIIGNLEAEVSKLSDRAAELTDRALEAEKFQAEKGFPLQGEIDPNFGSVAIDQAEARRLVQEGILDEGTDFVAGNWSAPYIKIQVETLFRKGLGSTKATVLTREASDFMDQYFKLVTNHEGIWPHFLSTVFDPLNRLFKETTLFLFPAVIPYTVRNFFSNAMLGWLGGIDLDSYKDAFRGMRQITNYNKGRLPIAQAETALRNEIFTNGAGKTASLHDIWGAFVHGGGLAGGLHVNEFAMSDNVLRESVKRGYTPASNLVSGSMLFDNKLLESGRNFSGMLENHFRFAAFMDSWKKGGSFEEAALNVKKIFYNYDELNMFERSVLKRVVPFYSWMRFNTPRMLETLATRPDVHYRVKSAMVDIERGAGGPADPEQLPSWLSNRWNVTIAREGGKLVVVGADYLLPMGDLRRLLGSPIQFGIDATTPFLKYPAEQLFNQSLFSSKVSDLFHGKGRPIERVPGEPARSGTLRDLGFSRRANPFEGPLGAMNLLMNESMVQNVRAVKWILDWVDWAWDNTNLREEVPTLNARLMDAFFARAYTIDPDRYHSIMQMENDKWVGRFKWGMRDAARRGDRELGEYYRSRMTEMATRK